MHYKSAHKKEPEAGWLVGLTGHGFGSRFSGSWLEIRGKKLWIVSERKIRVLRLCLNLHYFELLLLSKRLMRSCSGLVPPPTMNPLITASQKWPPRVDRLNETPTICNRPIVT